MSWPLAVRRSRASHLRCSSVSFLRANALRVDASILCVVDGGLRHPQVTSVDVFVMTSPPSKGAMVHALRGIFAGSFAAAGSLSRPTSSFGSSARSKLVSRQHGGPTSRAEVDCNHWMSWLERNGYDEADRKPFKTLSLEEPLHWLVKIRAVRLRLRQSIATTNVH